MVSSKPRTCIVDQAKYKYCPKCNKDNPRETWRFIYCSENCRDVYQVCDEYINNIIDLKTAYSKLSKLDTSNIENYTEYVAKPMAKEILEKGKPTRKKKTTVKKIDDK